MIAIKNLQSLSQLLIQEELIRAIATHYQGMVSNSTLKNMLGSIVKTSEKNSEEMLSYVASHK